MQETLSTFPDFITTLKECKGDVEKAQAEYIITAASWHTKLIHDVKDLLKNERKELQGFTPKMVLQEILGQKLQE